MRTQALSAFLAFAFAALTLSNGVSAQVARIEYHSVPTLTLSDKEILSGKREGEQVLIAGALNIPKAGNDRLPLVIILHGSGGPGGSADPTAEWSRELNALGIATFGLDSFAGRSLVTLNRDQAKLARLAMVVDAYRSLTLLARHPRIDPGRMALLGISRGGQGALYAAMKRFQKSYGPVEPEFAAFVALYPNCGTTYRDQGLTTGKPIRIMHGTADDYNPIAPCRLYVADARQAGADIHLTEYEGGHHGFDLATRKQLVACAACQTDRACKLREGDGGVILNLETQQPFSYGDACVARGTTVGYSEVEGPKARADIGKFFQELFQLK